MGMALFAIRTVTTMRKQKQFFFCLSFILLTLLCEPSEVKDTVRVGVVLDLNSTVGRVAKKCIEMALSDFYDVNANYRTRLQLFIRDSQNDVVDAASATIDLIKNKEVQVIIGPQRSAQANFVINLGGKAKVPIVSFSATSPSLSPTKNKFFIRTAHDDCFQVKAVADIVNAYGWREVIPIYEDTDYGNGLIPYLTDAFQEVNTRVPYRSVISPNSCDSEILKELKKLKQKEKRTTIFLVHMTASLGSKLFVQAKKAGMMSEGYAWIVTEGLSTLLDPVDSEDMDSMQGVLGLRPFIPKSRKLENFKSRWMNADKSDGSINGLNIFGLWAYDTVWAIAMSVEKAGTAHSSFLKPNTSKTSTVDIAGLGTFEMGERLLTTLLKATFEGLSGKFQLVKWQLQPAALEVFNVVGKYERIIGYWTKEKGLLRDLSGNAKAVKSTSMNKLKQPVWPGDTLEQPEKLRIGVPVRKGFTEFIKVERNPQNNKQKISGFSHEVFMAVLELLEFPLPYTFIPFEGKNGTSAGTYNALLYRIKEQEYDAVVGDTTIVANRSSYVDFTLPYIQSGVSMVVLLKDDERKKFWIFLKPLSWDLWLTTGVAFIFTGLVVWVLEHRTNTEFRGPPENQLGTIFWFSFSTLVFANRERVENNLSRFVLIIWIFVVLILTQSYTASLTSMLTVQRLQPLFSDVKEIQRHGHLVGYQDGSFVKDLLTKQLKFNESKLRSYRTPGEYHKALSKSEVAAIFDEIPYINLFLSKYCSRYTMVGPTYETGGFGFAFPQGSPLVSYISRAILNVTEDEDKIKGIEKKTFCSIATCEGQDTKITSDSLSLHSFGGLFIITGLTSMSALLLYIFKFVRSHWPVLKDIDPERSFLLKIVDLVKHFDKRDLSSHPLKRHESRVHPATSPEGNGASPDHNNDMENHSRTCNEGEENVVSDEASEIHPPGHSVASTSMDAQHTS